MKKMFPFLFVLMLLSPIFADGMVSDYDPQHGNWGVGGEARQLAAINYMDGKEKMLLAIEPKGMEGTKAVWIFPVPASPASTKLTLIDEFPQFSGTNIATSAGDSAKYLALGMAGSQVLPVVPFLMMGSFMNIFDRGYGSKALSVSQGAEGLTPWYQDQVQVYETLEKNGFKTELVGTKTQGALYYYLKGKGIEIPYEMQAALDKYVDRDYCFVVTYINDTARFGRQANAGNTQANAGNTQANAGNTQAMVDSTDYYNYPSPFRMPLLSVSIEFPTEKLYFPLALTSVYKERNVPATIYVMGHVSPEVYKDIAPDTKVEYFTADSYPQSSKPIDFFGKYNYASEFRFTKISINTPSFNYVDDLWMKNSAPIGTVLTSFVAKNNLTVAIILFAILSCAASLIAGTFIFKGTVPRQTLALVGLANFLTIIGFAAATYFCVKPKKRVGEHCRIYYIALFSAICFAIGCAIGLAAIVMKL